MEAKYEDFAKLYPQFKGYAETDGFRALFEELNQEASLLAMLQYVWTGRPALEGVVMEVEQFCENRGIDLEEKQTRKAVGALCAVCLRPFGYFPDERKKLKERSGRKYFKRAATYRENGPKTREVRMKAEAGAKYEDFAKLYPNFKRYAETDGFRALFEELNQEASLLAMLQYVWTGRPALEGVVMEVEQFCENRGIDLEEKQARKAVGALCAVCLRPFGYFPDERKKLKERSGSKYFKRAAAYRENGPKTREVRMKIVDLD